MRAECSRSADASVRPRGEPVRILLVEDNPGDVRLVREALNRGSPSGTLYVAEDGLEAMDFLRRQGKHREAPRPDLVLLDLNLPKKDGREVLAEIKSDEDLRRVPVVVLTSSEAEADVVRCYDLAANCYIVKPFELDRFMAVLQGMERFWLGVARLPRRA